MIKISVIITTYNAQKSIAKALDSVLHQNGVDKVFSLEIIIVDDCSMDDTTVIIRNYGLNWYSTGSTNSGGPNKGRNIGLRMAKGDYICFLDHDDYWDRNKLLQQLEVAHMAPIITCGYRLESTVHGTVPAHHSDKGYIKFYAENETFRKKLSKEKRNVQNTYFSTIMIHTSLKSILFEENFGMLDFDWLLRLFENKSSVEIGSSLVTRTVNGANLSLNAEYRKRDYYYSLMCLESYEKQYPAEVAKAFRRINGSRARYCYLKGEMRDARKYLLRARPGIKEIFYFLTSFYGYEWVRKNHVIFG